MRHGSLLSLQAVWLDQDSYVSSSRPCPGRNDAFGNDRQWRRARNKRLEQSVFFVRCIRFEPGPCVEYHPNATQFPRERQSHLPGNFRLPIASLESRKSRQFWDQPEHKDFPDGLLFSTAHSGGIRMLSSSTPLHAASATRHSLSSTRRAARALRNSERAEPPDPPSCDAAPNPQELQLQVLQGSPRRCAGVSVRARTTD